MNKKKTNARRRTLALPAGAVWGMFCGALMGIGGAMALEAYQQASLWVVVAVCVPAGAVFGAIMQSVLSGPGSQLHEADAYTHNWNGAGEERQLADHLRLRIEELKNVRTGEQVLERLRNAAAASSARPVSPVAFVSKPGAASADKKRAILG